VDSAALNSPNTAHDRLARGRRRARELAVEAELERQVGAAELERDLGRPPSAAERLLIETTAAQVVEGRKLRRQGKSSEMQDRLVYRGLSALGIRQGPAKPAGPSLQEYIATKYGKPPAAPNGAPASDVQVDETRTGEAAP
jgi:hypothetical protein